MPGQTAQDYTYWEFNNVIYETFLSFMSLLNFEKMKNKEIIDWIKSTVNISPALPTDITKPVKDLIHLFVSNFVLKLEKFLTSIMYHRPQMSFLTLDEDVNGHVVLTAFHVVSLTWVLLESISQSFYE